MGQTKVVEDGNNASRNFEERTTRCRAMKVLRMWQTLTGQDVIGLRQREDVAAVTPPPPDMPKTVYTAIGTPCTLENALALADNTTWPTLTVQSSQSLAAEQALMSE